MADEPISALTLFTSYSTADEVEILDVSDTTFASTGTNKRIQFSTLLTMAGVGSVQNESASTILGNPTGSPAAPSAITLYPNMGFVGTSLRAAFQNGQLRTGTPITNSTSSTSIFTGASSIGSLTIPANTLQVGSRLRFNIFGSSVRERYKFSDAHDQVPSRRRYARVVDDASSSDHLQWHRLDNLRLAHRFLGAIDRHLPGRWSVSGYSYGSGGPEIFSHNALSSTLPVRPTRRIPDYRLVQVGRPLLPAILPLGWKYTVTTGR